MTSLSKIRMFALLRTTLFVIFVPGTVLVYLPWAMGVFRMRRELGWDILGVLPLGVGVFVLLRCAFAFAWEGEGTPAPIDAPRHLVIGGMYRYVRNPMYWGTFLILLGQWALFAAPGWGAIRYIAVFVVLVHLFVVLYEEPALRRQFGDEYEEYRRNVPRWIPGLKAWRAAAGGD